jgi:GGDEF-like domain
MLQPLSDRLGHATPLAGLDEVVGRIADELEADLVARPLPLPNALIAELEARSVTLEGSLRRAASVALADALERLRALSPPAEVLPPEATSLARGWAAAGFDAARTSHLCLQAQHELTERLAAATERAGEQSAGALRWRAHRVTAEGLARHTLRLGELFLGEYHRELERLRGQGQRAAGPLVARVLEGEWVDAGELGYDLRRCHLALVSGAEPPDLVRDLSSRGDWQVLHTVGPHDVTWAWVASERELSDRDLDWLASWHRERGAGAAFGEPGSGLEGFRSSHDQALEAWSVAAATGDRVALYRDVALMIALLRDRMLASVFVTRELGQLASPGEREAELRRVARTYLESGQNGVVTASKLGCNRRTVERKLQHAERLMGHLLRQRSGEALLALRLVSLGIDERPAELSST